MSKNEADDRHGPRRMDAETSNPHAEQPREGTPRRLGIGVESKRVRFQRHRGRIRGRREDRRGPWEEAARSPQIRAPLQRGGTSRGSLPDAQHRLMIKTRPEVRICQRKTPREPEAAK
ncbi:hypothetical protein Q5P01_000914 [Channa striata]|uniref:Uncharacterized protein n=1 Tax=Channa striata TaxID=64152 RepID=A0AA88IJI1_CHASR|nr:hypothetical protein Q5P01_000914 [Channa striata]